jgi:hypothetical protein
MSGRFGSLTRGDRKSPGEWWVALSGDEVGESLSGEVAESFDFVGVVFQSVLVVVDVVVVRREFRCTFDINPFIGKVVASVAAAWRDSNPTSSRTSIVCASNLTRVI